MHQPYCWLGAVAVTTSWKKVVKEDGTITSNKKVEESG
jgi:hypothetical protein